jgi:cytoskeletal protein RodZ
MLEDDKWDNLPAPAFVRGFLLCYARHIGLGEDEVLRRYKKQALLLGKSSDTLPEGMRAVQGAAKPKVRVAGAPNLQAAPGSKNLDDGAPGFLTLPRVALGAGALVVLILISWLISVGKSERPKDEPQDVPVAEASTEADKKPDAEPAKSDAKPDATKTAEPGTGPRNDLPGAPVSPVPAVAARYTAEVRALEDNWINVRIDTDAPKGYQLKAGTARTFEAQSKIHFVFSNAGVVDLKWNGIRFGNVGFRGDVKSITLPEQLSTLEAKKNTQTTLSIQPRKPKPPVEAPPAAPPAEAAAPAATPED